MVTLTIRSRIQEDPEDDCAIVRQQSAVSSSAAASQPLSDQMIHAMTYLSSIMGFIAVVRPLLRTYCTRLSVEGVMCPARNMRDENDETIPYQGSPFVYLSGNARAYLHTLYGRRDSISPNKLR